jgi:hypothetical protein
MNSKHPNCHRGDRLSCLVQTFTVLLLTPVFVQNEARAMEPIYSASKPFAMIKGGINSLAPFRGGVLVLDTTGVVYHIGPSKKPVAIPPFPHFFTKARPMGDAGLLCLTGAHQFAIYDYDRKTVVHSQVPPVFINWAVPDPSGTFVLMIVDWGRSLWKFNLATKQFEAKRPLVPNAEEDRAKMTSLKFAATCPVIDVTSSNDALFFVDKAGLIKRVSFRDPTMEPKVAIELRGPAHSISCDASGEVIAAADRDGVTIHNWTPKGYLLTSEIKVEWVDNICAHDTKHAFVAYKGGGIDLISSTSKTAVNEEGPVVGWVRSKGIVYYGFSGGGVGEFDTKMCRATAYGVNDLTTVVRCTKSEIAIGTKGGSVRVVELTSGMLVARSTLPYPVWQIEIDEGGFESVQGYATGLKVFRFDRSTRKQQTRFETGPFATGVFAWADRYGIICSNRLDVSPKASNCPQTIFETRQRISKVWVFGDRAVVLMEDTLADELPKKEIALIDSEGKALHFRALPDDLRGVWALDKSQLVAQRADGAVVVESIAGGGEKQLVAASEKFAVLAFANRAKCLALERKGKVSLLFIKDGGADIRELAGALAPMEGECRFEIDDDATRLVQYNVDGDLKVYSLP